ncbi:MAG: hypothetical protein RL141_450 [Candidatus Parcubacteria bacterium]|jgi:ribosomal protein L29
MNTNDLRNHAPERLTQLAGEAYATVRALRFTVGTRQRTDVRALRKAKKALARLLTVQNGKKTTESSSV